MPQETKKTKLSPEKLAINSEFYLTNIELGKERILRRRVNQDDAKYPD